MGTNDAQAFDLLSLLDHSPQSSATPESLPEPEAPPPAPMSVGQKFQLVWLAAAAGLAALESAGRQAEENLRDVLAQYYSEGDLWWRTKTGLEADKCEKLRKEFAGDLFKQIVWLAERQFAPSGGSLTINAHDIPEALHYSSKCPAAFSPDALWKHLEQSYGGDAGERVAHQQAAKVFRHEFEIGHQKEVKVQAGFVVLEMRSYLDAFWKKDGKTRIAYHAQESLAKGLWAMGEIVCSFDETALAHDLRWFVRKVVQTHENVELRKTHELGGGAVKITVFSDKFVVKIRQDLADKLQMFLGEYSS